MKRILEIDEVSTREFRSLAYLGTLPSRLRNFVTSAGRRERNYSDGCARSFLLCQAHLIC